MARRNRFAVTGHPFHVTNRGVERRRLFFRADDYAFFLRLCEWGKERFPVSVLGLCLMPNHFHMIVRPEADRAVSSYLHWIQGFYSCDLRARTRTRGFGHVFQSRFWSGPIEDNLHLLNVLRYVEANPVAARLVSGAEDWPWSSLALRRQEPGRLLDPLPVALPAHWTEWVNQPCGPEEPD